MGNVVGYDLETVLNSTFCFGLLSKNSDSEPPAVSMTLHRVQRYEDFLKPPNFAVLICKGYSLPPFLFTFLSVFTLFCRYCLFIRDEYPIEFLHPSPDGDTGEVSHALYLGLGQTDTYEVADLHLLFGEIA